MSNGGAHGFPSLRKSTDEPFPVKVIIRKHRLKKDIGKLIDNVWNKKSVFK